MFDELDLDWAGRVPKMSEAGGSFLVGAVASHCPSCSAGPLPERAMASIGRCPEQH
jgi:hypothetical protein